MSVLTLHLSTPARDVLYSSALPHGDQGIKPAVGLEGCDFGGKLSVKHFGSGVGAGRGRCMVVKSMALPGVVDGVGCSGRLCLAKGCMAQCCQLLHPRGDVLACAPHYPFSPGESNQTLRQRVRRSCVAAAGGMLQSCGRPTYQGR